MDKTTVPIERQRIKHTAHDVKCTNKDMPDSIPDPPYYWDNVRKVRCIDWKFR